MLQGAHRAYACREVLITVMRKHQRYFSVIDEAGTLLPMFVAVANGQIDPATVIKGNLTSLSPIDSHARLTLAKISSTPVRPSDMSRLLRRQ